MLQIALIHPGTTDYDQQGRLQGNLAVPLNEQGGAECAQVAQELDDKGVSVVYAAACLPAVETGEAIAEHLEIKLKKLDKLENINCGLWQGMLVDDIKRKHPKVYRQWAEMSENVCPPEGETMADVKQRLQVSLKKLLKKHSDGTIALVLPSPLSELAVQLLGAGEFGAVWKVNAEYGHWEMLGVEPPSLVSSGDTIS